MIVSSRQSHLTSAHLVLRLSCHWLVLRVPMRIWVKGFQEFRYKMGITPHWYRTDSTLQRSSCCALPFCPGEMRINSSLLWLWPPKRQIKRVICLWKGHICRQDHVLGLPSPKGIGKMDQNPTTDLKYLIILFWLFLCLCFCDKNTCSCVCKCVETRDKNQVSFLSLPTLYFESGSHIEPGAHQWSLLASQQALRNPTISTSPIQCWSCRYTLPYPDLMWVPRTQTQNLILVQQALYPLNHLPNI